MPFLLNQSLGELSPPVANSFRRIAQKGNEVKRQFDCLSAAKPTKTFGSETTGKVVNGKQELLSISHFSLPLLLRLSLSLINYPDPCSQCA